MTTNDALLPPLPPIDANNAGGMSAWTGDLLAALTATFAGLSALTWAQHFDVTEGQVFVSAATTFTILAPASTYLVLRHRLRR